MSSLIINNINKLTQLEVDVNICTKEVNKWLNQKKGSSLICSITIEGKKIREGTQNCSEYSLICPIDLTKSEEITNSKIKNAFEDFTKFINKDSLYSFNVKAQIKKKSGYVLEQMLISKNTNIFGSI